MIHNRTKDGAGRGGVTDADVTECCLQLLQRVSNDLELLCTINMVGTIALTGDEMRGAVRLIQANIDRFVAIHTDIPF